jgi:hypothetical protein
MKSHPGSVPYGNIVTLVLVGIVEISLVVTFFYTLFGI